MTRPVYDTTTTGASPDPGVSRIWAETKPGQLRAGAAFKSSWDQDHPAGHVSSLDNLAATQPAVPGWRFDMIPLGPHARSLAAGRPRGRPRAENHEMVIASSCSAGQRIYQVSQEDDPAQPQHPANILAGTGSSSSTRIVAATAYQAIIPSTGDFIKARPSCGSAHQTGSSVARPA